MLLILSSEVPPPYNAVFSVFLPFTLQHVAILPYYLLLTLVSLPQIPFLPISGQISQYVSSPAPTLSLSLRDSCLPSGEYPCSVGCYFVVNWVHCFPGTWCPFPSTPTELKSCHSPLVIWDFVFCIVTFFLESLTWFWYPVLCWSLSFSASSYSSSFSSPT